VAGRSRARFLNRMLVNQLPRSMARVLPMRTMFEIYRYRIRFFSFMGFIVKLIRKKSIFILQKRKD
jgi:hypothetical protein